MSISLLRRHFHVRTDSMIEAFKKLKKRAAKKCCLCAGISGGSGVLLTLGTLFLVLKSAGRPFLWYAYLAAVGVGAVIAAAIFLFAYPTTKRFAKRLDKQYALGERVQTMVEYSLETGAVVQLQREDTRRVLSTLPKIKKGFGFWAQTVLLPVLAIGVFGASLALPKNTGAGTEKPLIVIYSEEEELFDCAKAIPKMQLLIENVKLSNLEDGLKQKYLSYLGTLLALLEEGDMTNSQMVFNVRTTMNLVFDSTTERNTFNVFVSAMKGDADMKALRESLRGSRNTYKKLSGDRVSTTWDMMQDGVSDYLAEYSQWIEASTEEAKTQEAYVEFLDNHVQKLKGVLANEKVAALPATDGIKNAFVKLSGVMEAQVNGLTTEGSGIGLSGAQTSVKNAVNTFKGSDESGAVTELSKQAHCFMMKEYVMENLQAIFGVLPPQEEQGDRESDEPQAGGNTTGSGELKYPGNGEVLDVDSVTYKHYAELLDSVYISKYTQWIDKELYPDNPELSKELKDYIEAYFAGLKVTK